MAEQDQFLNVIDRDEAERRFRAALNLQPLGAEDVPLSQAWGRVLADDVLAPVDVPAFDRSNFDGFALRAAETFGAGELAPRTAKLRSESLHAGTAATIILSPGEAVAIATGGMLPRGADAVLMIEHAEVRGEELIIRRAVAPGHGIAFAGTDIARGETVLRVGTVLTSRETGVLAAIGVDHVSVCRQPKVAIISTGNELIPPGEPLPPACVYDSNSQVLCDTVRELGGSPRAWGIVQDDIRSLRTMLHAALAESDVVLLSGGTSKGQGDLCYRVVSELLDPGIVAHGVALKPGKPLCLAVTQGKPVVILPGFPTSAIFTFQEFVAPVIRSLAGYPPVSQQTVPATLALKTNSEIGRTEYLLVGLVKTDDGLSAFPMGKGSGSVTTFSRADGFITIPRHTEIIDAGMPVDVRLLGRDLAVADLVVIGSHCVGLDYLLSQLQRRGITSKLLTVGSSAGLAAARRGECDLAGIHLLDPETGVYNRPFLTADVELITGYRRMQGIVFRADDERFANKTLPEVLAMVTSSVSSRSHPHDGWHALRLGEGRGFTPLSTPIEDSGRATQSHNIATDEVGTVPASSSHENDMVGAPNTTTNLVMVNRNAGSGTRILMDRLLSGAKPPGYAVQPASHNAVAAAVVQGRADWGLCIQSVAAAANLGFLPCQEEHYDFAILKSRRDRPAVQAFLALLQEDSVREKLTEFGFPCS